MDIKPEDAAYLLTSIRNGSAMLVLGAGASMSSTNARNEKIKSGWGLAKALCDRAGIDYNGEMLTEVLGAVQGSILSSTIVNDILRDEYRDCNPSKEFSRLFNYTWKRVYTWNIDDLIENINQTSAQKRAYFNGMIDKAVEFEGSNRVHIIHLHGDVNKLEHGVIFTEQEYSIHIKSDKHYWYQRAAQDYLSTCPIFIGSQLAEPILAAELERAKREANSVSGRAYLIVPDEFTPIQKANYAGKGIIHLKGTLEEFSDWLTKKIPGGWSSKDVVSSTNKIPDNILDQITPDEIVAANFLRLRDPRDLRTKFETLRPSEKDKLARQFLQGFPPTWGIAASTVPVWLDGTNELYKQLSVSITNNHKLFVAAGQAGSGKSTALMQACLKFAEANNVSLYELDPNVKSISNAFRLLKRVEKGKKAILYIGDLFVYGDLFRGDLEAMSGEDFTIVTTSRSGEWKEHHDRYLGDIVVPFMLKKFSRKDYDPLIERLTKYVPSPTFRQLKKPEQYKKLTQSNSQLLIALREATGSENFNLIIANEFEGLPDADTRMLFVIVGLATIARVGLSVGIAREAYQLYAKQRSFDAAVGALEGIVSENPNGRLQARHELYVRHILESSVAFSEISEAIIAILRNFVKFDIPIVRKVARLDSVLFRSIINHHFIAEHAKRYGKVSDGLVVYESFEVDFQLDGHYWLQYGLYLANMSRLSEAGVMLGRSIDAYPNNMFAVHALADIELRIAKERKNYDIGTKSLIDKAVLTLLKQDAQSVLEIDQYPIVTLTNGHIAALIRHNKRSEAKIFAKQYFERIQQIERTGASTQSMVKAKDRLLRLITLDEWYDKGQGQQIRKKSRRSGRSRRGFNQTKSKDGPT